MSIQYEKGKSEEVLFCEDYNPLTVMRTNTSSEFIKVTMKMLFSGYGIDTYEVVQIYDYVIFENKVEIFPGEEVQDFFMEVNSKNVVAINENNKDIATHLLYRSAIVTLLISEVDSKGEIFKEYSLENLRYLPGKKPLAYPYLTNAKVRTTYSESLIFLSALGIDLKSKNLGNISGNIVDTASVNEDYSVFNIAFRRSFFDTYIGDHKTIQNQYLTLEPIPNPRNHIDLIFMNQNLCPDWLSFSGEWEQYPELTHVLSNNTTGKVFKVKSGAKRILKLNTGWLFEEEVILIDELMNSKYCFIKLKDKWIRAIPISKKPLNEDSERNVNSQIVEFQIAKENER